VKVLINSVRCITQIFYQSITNRRYDITEYITTLKIRGLLIFTLKKHNFNPAAKRLPPNDGNKRKNSGVLSRRKLTLSRFNLLMPSPSNFNIRKTKGDITK